MTDPNHHDSDVSKGVVEQEVPQPGMDNPFQHGQIGHRDNDSDFPEPGAREEHTGEHK
jgi:hypothetical protein